MGFLGGRIWWQWDREGILSGTFVHLPTCNILQVSSRYWDIHVLGIWRLWGLTGSSNRRFG